MEGSRSSGFVSILNRSIRPKFEMQIFPARYRPTSRNSLRDERSRDVIKISITGDVDSYNNKFRQLCRVLDREVARLSRLFRNCVTREPRYERIARRQGRSSFYLPKEMIKQTSMGREVDIAFPRRGSFTYWYTISHAFQSFHRIAHPYRR